MLNCQLTQHEVVVAYEGWLLVGGSRVILSCYAYAGSRLAGFGHTRWFNCILP